MPGTPFNPYQNAPKGSPITAVNKGDPAQIGKAIGTNVLGNTSGTPVASGIGALFNSSTGVSVKYVMYWGVGALALIALAGPYPDMATGFTVLLIVGVLLTHYQEYTALFAPPKK